MRSYRWGLILALNLCFAAPIQAGGGDVGHSFVGPSGLVQSCYSHLARLTTRFGALWAQRVGYENGGEKSGAKRGRETATEALQNQVALAPESNTMATPEPLAVRLRNFLARVTAETTMLTKMPHGLQANTAIVRWIQEWEALVSEGSVLASFSVASVQANAASRIDFVALAERFEFWLQKIQKGPFRNEGARPSLAVVKKITDFLVAQILADADQHPLLSDPRKHFLRAAEALLTSVRDYCDGPAAARDSEQASLKGHLMASISRVQDLLKNTKIRDYEPTRGAYERRRREIGVSPAAPSSALVLPTAPTRNGATSGTESGGNLVRSESPDASTQSVQTPAEEALAPSASSYDLDPVAGVAPLTSPLTIVKEAEDTEEEDDKFLSVLTDQYGAARVTAAKNGVKHAVAARRLALDSHTQNVLIAIALQRKEPPEAIVVLFEIALGTINGESPVTTRPGQRRLTPDTLALGALRAAIAVSDSPPGRTLDESHVEVAAKLFVLVYRELTDATLPSEDFRTLQVMGRLVFHLLIGHRETPQAVEAAIRKFVLEAAANQSAASVQTVPSRAATSQRSGPARRR